MRQLHLVAMFLLLILGQMAGASRAGQIVLDQHWPANSDGVWEFGSGPVGTVIDVSVSGKLDRIELYMNIRRIPASNPWPAADMRWFIRTIEDGRPASTDIPPLATGVIPGAEFEYQPKAMIVDASSFNLSFDQGEQFALTLHGGAGALYRWLAYRGHDAPQRRGFKLFSTDWYLFPSRDFQYDPPYSAGYSTYIEPIPEPTSLAIVAISLQMFAIPSMLWRRHRSNSGGCPRDPCKLLISPATRLR